MNVGVYVTFRQVTHSAMLIGWSARKGKLRFRDSASCRIIDLTLGEPCPTTAVSLTTKRNPVAGKSKVLFVFHNDDRSQSLLANSRGRRFHKIPSTGLALMKILFDAKLFGTPSPPSFPMLRALSCISPRPHSLWLLAPLAWPPFR